MSFFACRTFRLVWLVIAAAALTAARPAHAADSGKRLALVIGNSSYQGIAPLTNPTNDAKDVAAKLKSLQFEVLLATDASQEKMHALLQEFRAKITRDHVALVFYAGHGVTVNNESFLLPVDMPDTIDLDEKGELGAFALNLQLVSMASVLSPLEGAKLGIVFLDACRTSLSSQGLGLTVRTAAVGQGRSARIMRGTGSLDVKPSSYSAGVFRAYATQLDNVASDGLGRNSPFTKALLLHIGTKGLSIQELMIRVRKSVVAETKSAQVPWEEAALNEMFYFVPTGGGPPAFGPGGGNPAAKRTGGGGGNRPNNLPPNIGVGVGSGF